MDEAGQWLGLVPCVPFIILTLMVGWQEGYLSCKKNFVLLIFRSCVLEQVEEENWLTKVHLGKWLLSDSSNQVIAILLSVVT